MNSKKTIIALIQEAEQQRQQKIADGEDFLASGRASLETDIGEITIYVEPKQGRKVKNLFLSKAFYINEKRISRDDLEQKLNNIV